ncbi:unnamed protein product, partial [marine sediment metagenome]
GDLGKFISTKCGCGRNNKIIEIFGRKDYCLRFNNAIYTEKDIAELLDIPGVILYQIVKKDDELNFHILSAEINNKDLIKNEINDRFRKISESRLNVYFVKSIKPEESGKFRTLERIS